MMLPCGHPKFTILEGSDQSVGLYMVRCLSCKLPWVIHKTNGNIKFIEVESLFTLDDLKAKGDER